QPRNDGAQRFEALRIAPRVHDQRDGQRHIGPPVSSRAFTARGARRAMAPSAARSAPEPRSSGGSIAFRAADLWLHGGGLSASRARIRAARRGCRRCKFLAYKDLQESLDRVGRDAYLGGRGGEKWGDVGS